MELENAALVTVEAGYPLVIETDASEIAIAATLNQNGRPIAFFSRTLSSHEKHQSSVEKEACAIVEAVRKWRHYLLASPFQVVTDQRSVAFMYASNHRSKIKNEKIIRWRMELSPFRFDIIYRPGKDNAAADALSRISGSLVSSKYNLKDLHEALCHPGITRMNHFVRVRNLPFSISDIREVTSRCRICAEAKPRFYQPLENHLVKATQPFERISMDFKGPLPSVSRNRYLLTMIDEYSRFPFAFPTPDMSSQTIINCLTQLFTIFGMPSYIHSDRGSSFMSSELMSFLYSKGIATSRTTPYNPQSNGQVERLNASLWKTVTLALNFRNLSIEHWESVLNDSLHSIRSLLNTVTNCTPHERMFTHSRRSTSRISLPSWLLSPGPILLKRNVRSSKFEPLVEEVELLQSNPQYAHVRFPNGKEDTVSLRQLAPLPNTPTSSNTNQSPHSHNISPETNTPTSDPEAPIEHLSDMYQKQQRVHSYNLRNRED